MTRKEIDQKYLDQHGALGAEFFRIVHKGKPKQHRVLRQGKTTKEFNQRHGEIWRNHEAELIAEGFIKPLLPPELGRDLEAEIDELRAELTALKGKK